MKSHPQRHKPDVPQTDKGFALVITLSLMILLTVIAVGMLSLSAISLRSSSQGMAQSEAQANARLALMLAIGDLQKHLGPDRAITATSEILSNTPAKPNTTGVWESWWDFNPNTAPDYSAEKTNRFRRWLVSSANMAAPQARDFVTSGWTGKTIELVGSGSLGAAATAADKVTAGLVPLSKNGKVQGSFGWHVSDESVKARINLYRDPSQDATLAQKRALLAGHRPDPSVIRGAGGAALDVLPSDLTSFDFANATASIGKIINLEQAELLDQAKGKIKPFRNDITPYSLGVLADVRRGGLKQDLSSMFEADTLPSDYDGGKLYASTHGITDTSLTSSDPNWSALAGYYNSFRSLTDAETNPTFAVKPPELLPDGTINPVPVGYNPAPVIAKVDTIFSLVGRPLTDIYWLESNPNWDICANLVITPVVTLHNPYNVSISFNKMQVNFTNIPVAFNYMLQEGGAGPFVSQGVVRGAFESLNTMNYKQYRNDKIFGITIANWSDDDPLDPNKPWNAPVDGPVVLKPGQTLVCSPTLSSKASFRSDSGSGGNAVGFDWQNDLTPYIKAKPEFTPGLGFEISGVNIGNMRAAVKKGSWCWFMMLRDQNTAPKISQSKVTDRFYVEFKLQRPSWYVDDSTSISKEVTPIFEVTARIQTSDRAVPVDLARLQFDYKNTTTLENVIDNRVYRYPSTGSLRAADIVAPGGTRYGSQYTYVHPFAIFSAYTRTTRGGVYETGLRTGSPGNLNMLRDGRLAGKPFLFHNPSKTDFKLDLANEKPGVQPYEVNLQPFLSKGDYEDYFDVDANNRVPSLSGNRTTTGIKSGSYLEIPSGPLQTIADFRRSNALTTSYLPHFVQPVGNSRLHPLMSADKLIEKNLNITSTDLLDHSVLANHALYDRFYFSTFATRGNETPARVFEQFMNGTRPLASQSFQPYLPAGKTVATASAELFDSGKPNNNAYRTAAEYQMIRGPFNVNSTSVQAWKAVLAAMNKSDVATLWASTAVLESTKASGAAVTAMSLVNGGGVIPGPATNEAARSNNWNGYRELNQTELEALATRIVEQVRERGPFLSMSEFVNRQVGPTGPRTLSGALEAAIEKSGINEDQGAVYLDQVPITTADVSDPKLYAYKTPQATTGNPAAGAPGWINQGDLLRILEPGATVRGDTFVIRTYGEAQDGNGKITARAYAEAVVQRVPEYVDPADRPSVNASTGSSAEAANRTFGRRINVVSFRWLSSNEI